MKTEEEIMTNYIERTEDMELLEIKDVLPILKCNANTFRTWIKRGQLPEGLVLKIGNTQRIRKTVLLKWISGELQ